MVPALGHEINEGANDSIQVNVNSGSKPRQKIPPLSVSASSTLWQSIIFIVQGHRKYGHEYLMGGKSRNRSPESLA